MIHIGLFEGIGGFSLAASQMGWNTLVTCEINPFGQRVLKYYWPNAYHHADVKTLNYDTINSELSNRFGAGWRNDDIIITGGFPCQPYSLAGKRLGKEDDRHLWPEMLRVIREVQPTWVVGENVFGLVNWNGGLVFDEVQADLEVEGYEVQPYVLPACGVNAPHKRDRVWFIAHRYNESRQEGTSNRKREGCEQIRERSLLRSYPGPISEKRTTSNSDSQQSERMQLDERESCQSKQRESGGMGCEGITEPNDSNSDNERLERSKIKRSISESQEKRIEQSTGLLQSAWENFPTQPPVCDGNNGLSSRLVGITFPKWRNESIKAMGNAIVPQVALEIFKVIQQMSK